MDKNKLIQMANQIGTFFESMPDVAEAELGIANHLQKFWDPRMRRAFLESVDSQTAQDLKPIVLAAVRDHRHLLA